MDQEVGFKRFIQVSISIILLSVLIYWIDVAAFIGAVKHANYFHICLALVLVGINRCVMAYKWNMLLKVKSIRMSFVEATRIYYISNFLGMYLPPTIGGDLVRAYYIKKKNYQMADVLASIVVERIIGFLVLLLFAILGVISLYVMYFESRVEIRNALTVVVCISVGGLLVVILSLNKGISSKVLMFLERRRSAAIVGKVANKVAQIYASFLLYKKSKGILLLFSMLTGLEVFIYVLRAYVVVQALHVDISFSSLLSFVPIIMTLIRLPISFNGFGINEGGFVYFLSLMGISKSIGFSVGLIDHLIVMVAILPGGILYLLDQGIRSRRRNEGKKRAVVQDSTI
jgi:glycosyltransferase 2 family protein